MKHTSGRWNKAVSTLTTLALICSLASCGGGGGEDEAPSTSGGIANVLPSVEAGLEQSVIEQANVILSGTAMDTDGSIVTYQWLQTSGQTVTLTNSNSASTSFTAPVLDSSETLTFTLTVTDNNGGTVSDSVDIIVNAASSVNTAPSANAGVDQSVEKGGTVTLSAEQSSDADGDALSFAWALSTQPNGSIASLSLTNSIETSLVTDVVGEYSIELTVNDGQATSAVDTVKVIVTESSNDTNVLPSVEAGLEQSVIGQANVSLTGTAMDSDGSIVTYQWLQTSGKTVTLTNSNSASASFTAPVLDSSETLTFTLTVTDDDGGTASDSVDIIVNAASSENTAPSANAGVDQSVEKDSTVTLSAEQSSDADGDALSFAWALSTQPNGSIASLSSTNSIETSFVTDVVGEYSIELTVNDGQITSEVDIVKVVVTELSNGPVDITNAMLTNQSGSCEEYVGSYYSNAEDVQRGIDFNGDIVITTSNDKCIFAVNEIPNHDFNNGTASFVTNVSEQSGSYELPRAPVNESSVTELSLNTTNALLLNGVAIDLLAAACYDVGNEPIGQEKIGCGDNEINNPWRYDPMSPLNSFGTDKHNAHAQPDGTYHYHGSPVALFNVDCDITAETSPVIGFAADGYPVYGSCFSDNGNVRKAQSSYALKANGGTRQGVSGYTTPSASTGNIASNNYDGQFRGDYEYVENSGDLDECNGMTINGQYGYYIIDAYPWVLNCYKGTPDSSMNKQGAGLRNLMHVHDENTHKH